MDVDSDGGWTKDNWGVDAIIFVGLCRSLLGVCPVLMFLGYLRRRFGKDWQNDTILVEGILLERQEVQKSDMDSAWRELRIAYSFEIGDGKGAVYVDNCNVSKEVFDALGEPGSCLQIRRHQTRTFATLLGASSRAEGGNSDRRNWKHKTLSLRG